MDATPKSSHYTDWLQTLRRACDWIGISQGRAARYGKLVREFFEEGERSQEHILAPNESCEIIDIYERWESPIHNFPGLKQKIKGVFSKGPILREDERPDTSSTSNRPRNDAFVYLLAGKLISLGVNVIVVDGVARQGISCHADTDITFEWNESDIDIQCKRPQTQKALERRVKEARRQLKGRTGIIAVDCSAFVRPLGKLLQRNSAQDAESFLASLLEKEVKLNAERHLETNVLGFFLFARAPAMTRMGHSSILSVHGSPMNTTYRPDSISTWLVISNSRSLNPDVLPSIFNRT